MPLTNDKLTQRIRELFLHKGNFLKCIIQSQSMGDIKEMQENKPFSTYKTNNKTKHKDNPNVCTIPLDHKMTTI